MRYHERRSHRKIEGPKGGSSTCIITLLQCEHHGQYSGYVVAMTRRPVGPCPQCTADSEFYSKAAQALARETGGRPTHAQVLARAEQMAGKPILRYRHG